MDEVQLIVVAHDEATATLLADLLAGVPEVQVEALVRTRPSVVVVTAVEPGQESEWVRRLARLSERERDVLQELVDGRTVRLAAEHLSISINTCRTHIKSILVKVGAHSSLEAASLAVTGGMRPRRGEEAAAAVPAGGWLVGPDGDGPGRIDHPSG